MANQTSWLQQWLERVWYQNGKGRFLLLPFTALYCTVNQYQRRKQTRNLPKFPCSIIVVGNITVGGTGKTPLTIYITKLLQEKGYKPAIITRGYGGKAATWPQKVSAETDPELVGDEAVLMAKRTAVPVMAGANRLDSIQQLLDLNDIDVIVSDDGMQHYKMPRDIQIAVIDATRMLGNGYCLPAGPLREKKERLDDCDFVVLNGGSNAKQPWFSMSLQGNILINLKTNQTISLSDFNHTRVNAVTGIGNPKRFYKTIEQGGLTLNTISFPDHHSYIESDLYFQNDYPIIMTEKDAVKCKAFANTIKNDIWILPIDAEFDPTFDKQLIDTLRDL